VCVEFSPHNFQLTFLFFRSSSLSLLLSSTQYSLYSQVELNVGDLKNALISNDKINVTNYEAWDEFNAQYYEFLPKHPTVSGPFCE
jgi:hypothetical protein